jgi:hypothetical protein
MFGSSYRCERLFSLMIKAKSGTWTRLIDGHFGSMRIQELNQTKTVAMTSLMICEIKLSINM